MRRRLEPVKEAAKIIKNHLWGIINAIILKVSNGSVESINSRIKTVKVRSRRFRNDERLQPPFISTSEVWTSPPECSENHVFTRLAQEPTK